MRHLQALAAALISVVPATLLANSQLAAQQRPPVTPQCEAPLAGVHTYCASVRTSGGYDLRTILTKPTRARAGDRLPAIYLVQWLSCDPITVPASGGDGWAQFFRAMIERSALVVARTEKAGLPGSGGPACSELGFEEELEGHRVALAALRRSPHVHPDSIFILGVSLGGAMAPLLRTEGVRGLMVWGTTGVSWAEHMLAMDRRVFALRAAHADSIHAWMGEQMLLHALYLGQQQPPQEVVERNPALARAWSRVIGTDSTMQRHYGRPVAFHHEAQRANWEGAWARLDLPVLVVWGEYDWIMPPLEHERIVDLVNARAPGRARGVQRARAGHGFLTYASPSDAFRDRDGAYDADVVNVFLNWLAEHRGR